jgi:hypothetical protein
MKKIHVVGRKLVQKEFTNATEALNAAQSLAEAGYDIEVQTWATEDEPEETPPIPASPRVVDPIEQQGLVASTTIEQLVPAFRTWAQNAGTNVAIALLQKYGAQRLTDLKAGQLGAFAAELV